MAAKTDVADVLIIGSGAAGGAFAWSLSKMSGIKIVCLEQGEWVGKPESPDAAGQRQRLVASPPPLKDVKYVAGGYPYDYSESYWEPVLGNAVGGATTHYGAIWARLHPSDFVTFSLDGVADDWPIRYPDLAPYYDMNDKAVGVAGVPGNPAQPPRSNELQPPTRLSAAGEILSVGFKKLGWHMWPTEQATITAPYGTRLPSTPAAKNRSDLVQWPEAIRNGVVMKSRSRVREILVSKQGVAEGALYYDAEGRLQEQRARLVVVACNGIGTPRLLLNSKSSVFPNGLSNRTGLVGRNLMGHPKGIVTAEFESQDSSRGGSAAITSEQFYETDRARGFVGGWWWMSTGDSGPIAAALGTSPATVADFTPAELQSPGLRRLNPVSWGRTHHVTFAERYTRNLSISVYTHELPMESNCVVLHPTLTDDLGIPAPKLILKRTENCQKILAFALERSKDLMRAAGATRIISAEITGAGAGHYLGTARMGNDPGTSVVDKWCRSHDVRNLFIIDGSVFVTSGAVTPTSTIQAIALRTADYIKDNSRNLLS